MLQKHFDGSDLISIGNVPDVCQTVENIWNSGKKHIFQMKINRKSKGYLEKKTNEVSKCSFRRDNEPIEIWANVLFQLVKSHKLFNY